MDVGNPSNFARLLDLFDGDHKAMCNAIEGYAFTDEETKNAMREVHKQLGYLLDPHGAVGYLGLKEWMRGREVNGIFLETAHPAKFKEVVDATLQENIDIPGPLQKFLQQEKITTKMSSDFDAFKTFLREIL